MSSPKNWSPYNSPQHAQINSPSLKSENLNYEKDEIDEQQEHRLVDLFITKNETNQNKRFENDFIVEDQDQRNILHQTALRQDDRLLEILIQEYEAVIIEQAKEKRKQQQKDKEKDLLNKINLKEQGDEFEEEAVILEQEWEDEDYKNDPAIKNKIINYVRKIDHFGCTPIQICCFNNDVRLVGKRMACLKVLIENGSDVNSYNPNNRWGPLHWCAFYGDRDSVKILLENGAHAFLCDKNGMYPLDLAGKNNHKKVSRLLVKKSVGFLTQCQQFDSGELRVGNEVYIQFQEICQKYEAEVKNPLLYCKILYWCCFYSFNKQIDRILRNLPRIYIMYPIKSLESQSCLHACCLSQNYDGLQIIVKFEILQISMMGPKKDADKQVEKDKKREKFYNKILFDDYLKTLQSTDLPGIPQLLQTESQSLYKPRYYKELKQYLALENKYKQSLLELKLKLEVIKSEIGENKEVYRDFKEQFCKDLLQIDVQDLHGNTPLHLASLNGDIKIIKYLINKFANSETENNEFFRARQLTRDLNIQTFYDDLIKKNRHKHDQAKIQELKQIFNKHKKSSIKQQLTEEQKRNLQHNLNQKQKTQKQIKKQQKQLLTKTKSSKGQKGNDIQITAFNSSQSPNKIKQTSKKKEKTELIEKQNKPAATKKVVPIQIQPDNRKQQKYVEQLKYFSSSLFVPEIVLKINKLPKTSIFNMLKSVTDDEQRIKKAQIEMQVNFQIALLQSAGFEIFMMKSFLSESIIYIMLRLNEKQQEQLAQEMEIQIKLVDSYDFECFKKSERRRFEPFRSSQRQKIAYQHLLNSINLGSLIKSEIVQSCYPMHTSGGIQIVKNEWQKLISGFIPQPFCQINDYLKEGKGRNFTSLTTMRLYFGEQISYFFAWLSYISCMQLFIAVPGLILQIYIQSDFTSDIIPYWVIIVTIWSTVQVEFWKRKTSEINTRWGCIDEMMLAESSNYEGPIKAKFSGDEEINFISGKVTKHQRISKMAVYFVLFIILIGVFLVGSFGIVYGIDLLKQQVVAYKGFIFLLGALQAVAIQLLNLLFHQFSVWYAEQENHKFQLTYEKSLIYKNVFFRFINSYMPLIYIIVTNNDYTLEDIFYFLIPLVLVKKAYYILIDFLIPALHIRLKNNQYFQKINEEISKQKQNYEIYLDEIEQFWAAEENEKTDATQQSQLLKSAARPVLKIQSEQIIEEQLSKGKHCPLETKMDTDAIEMNSHREDFGGTLDYYMEAITDYGYYILFSAAFPIGPLIGIVLNMIDIQMKLYKLIYISKRIQTERAAGIGEWLNVLEFLGACSVITNFVLLYFKHKSATLRMFSSDWDTLEKDNLDLWYFISCILAISLIKILVRELIPDRPQWVIEEIDKINHRDLIQQQAKTTQNLKEMEQKVDDIEQEIKTSLEQVEIFVKQAEYQIKQLDAEIRELSQKFQYLTKYKKTDKQNQLITEYDMIVLSILKMRFYQLDNALILKRIQQFLETKTYFLSICQECGNKSTDIECIECEENFCAQCFQQIHKLINQANHTVILITASKKIKEQMQLSVVKEPVKVVPFEESKIYKKKIQTSEPKRNWRKLEYFQIPLQENSGYTKLNQLYDDFYQFYLRSAGFEYRDFSICLDKILPLQNLTLMKDDSLRIEDKIFLNRTAFYLFKKKKNIIQLEQFIKTCIILENGTFEQKLIIFFDFIDINEDDTITKDELENLLLTSFIQDVKTNKKVGEMIDNFFPNCAVRQKKEIFLEFSNRVQRSDELKSYLECLLQAQT